MSETCKNEARFDGATGMSKRTMTSQMMMYTTPERKARLVQAAHILIGAGVGLPASGYTGIVNDFADSYLLDYVANRLEEAGYSKAQIKFELEKLRR